MALGCKPSLNSIFGHGGGNSIIAFKHRKPKLGFRKVAKFYNAREIFTQKQCFCDKMSRAPEDSDSVENVTEWARVSPLEVAAEGFQDGKYGRHLAAMRPSRTEKLIGRQIYQYALVIMREYGNDTNRSKINSRKTVDK